MANGKEIFENERRALPDDPYVTLTEAITWIVAGNCRDDNYLAEMWQRQGDQNQRDWGSRYGPAWLLPHLELLAKGEEWQFDEAVGKEDRQSTLSQFEKTKNWLSAHGADSAAAYKRAKDQCDHDSTEAARLEACEELIFKAGAAGEVELLGIAYNDENGKWEGSHTAIPYTYFLQPVFHRMGLKPEGTSWGHLVEADLTPGMHSENEDMKQADTRPAYSSVLIRRLHVERLKEWFQGGARADRAQALGKTSVRSIGFSRAAAERWYRQVYVPSWDPATRNPSEQDDLKAAQEMFPGIPRDVVRYLRRNFAPPEWKKPGRPAKIQRH